MQKKRVRLTAEESKDRIVTAAIELIATKGFLETSFQMIADKCGISQSAVMHHFKNKEELVEGVLKQLLQHNHSLVAASIRQEDDARTRLIKHFSGNLTWAIRYEHEAQMLLLLYYFASYHPHFAGIYSEILKNARLRIREHILAGVRERLFPANLNADETAEQMHDALLGSFVNYLAIRKAGRKPKHPNDKWEKLIKFYEAS